MKRISPAAIATPTTGTPQSGQSARSDARGSVGTLSSENRTAAVAAETATAAQAAATAPGAAEGWVAPMAAEVLLLRGRLALLDGKLRVGDGCVSPTHVHVLVQNTYVRC